MLVHVTYMIMNTLCCPATVSLTLVTTELPALSSRQVWRSVRWTAGWGGVWCTIFFSLLLCFLALISWLLERSFWRMANSLASHDRWVLAVRASLTVAVTLNLSSSMKLRSTFNSGKQYSNKSYEYSNRFVANCSQNDVVFISNTDATEHNNREKDSILAAAPLGWPSPL